MIVIVTTITVYLAVYKGVPMEDLHGTDEKPKRRNPFRWLSGLVKWAREKV